LRNRRDVSHGSMIRIEISESGDLVTFALSGRIENEDLEELKTLLEKNELRLQQHEIYGSYPEGGSSRLCKTRSGDFTGRRARKSRNRIRLDRTCGIDSRTQTIAPRQAFLGKALFRFGCHSAATRLSVEQFRYDRVRPRVNRYYSSNFLPICSSEPIWTKSNPTMARTSNT